MGALQRLLQRARLRALRGAAGSSPLSERLQERTRVMSRGRRASTSPTLGAAERQLPKDGHPPPKDGHPPPKDGHTRPKDGHPPPKDGRRRAGLVERAKRLWRGLTQPSIGSRDQRTGFMDRAKRLWRGRTPPSFGSRDQPEILGGSKTGGPTTAESLKSIDRRLQNLERRNLFKWFTDAVLSVFFFHPEKLREYAEKLREYREKLDEYVKSQADSNDKLDETFISVTDMW